MTQIILIIIGIAIIVILLSRKSREKVVGICAAAIGLDAKKRENEEPPRKRGGIGILPKPTLLRQGYGRVILLAFISAASCGVFGEGE